MKNTIWNVTTKTVIGLIIAVFAAACSDGGHANVTAVTPDIAPPAITFGIGLEGAEKPTDTAVSIDAGQSVVLYWEVIGAPAGDEADKASEKADDAEASEDGPVIAISIDSKELGYHKTDLKASDSLVVPNVTVDASFILTAVIEGAVPASETVRASIKVAGFKVVETLELTAYPEKIVRGGSSELCWTISPADAGYEVTDENGNIVAIPTHEATEAEVEEEAAEALEGEEETEEMIASGKASYAGEEGEEEEVEENTEEDAEEAEAPSTSKGCVVVTPEVTTTYFIDAEDGSTDNVTIEVMDEVTITSFNATPETISGETEVRLSWKVDPAEAIVTISPKLDGQEFESEGETTVTISEETTFTISAVLPGCEECADQKTFTVVLEQRGELAVDITASTQVIFAGEEAEITWQVVDRTNGTNVSNANMIVRGGSFGLEGETRESSGTMILRPTETTEYTLEASAGSGIIVPEKLKIIVRNWDGPSAANVSVDSEAEKTQLVTSVAASTVSTDIMYAGFAGKLDSDGQIKLAKGSGSYWSTLEINFLSAFKGFNDGYGAMNNNYLNEVDYPVNAIAVDLEDEKTLYVATSGGVVKSTDGGASWSLFLRPFMWAKDSNYTGSHASCAGTEQKGWKDWTINALQQVCDIVIAKDGTIVVASDHKVAVAAKDAEDWTDPVADAPVYGIVNHDLELAELDEGKETLFVGTSEGIYVSTDMGASYEAIGGAGAPDTDVYTVKVDTAAGKLYAGTPEMVYTCTLSADGCSAWSNQIVSGGVFSIALDPIQAGSVFAATAQGVYYSADGDSWKDVTAEPMATGVTVRSIASTMVDDGAKGSVYIATSDGVFVTTSEILTDKKDCKNPPCPKPTDDAPEEDPEETPDEENPLEDGEETVNGNLL